MFETTKLPICLKGRSELPSSSNNCLECLLIWSTYTKRYGKLWKWSPWFSLQWKKSMCQWWILHVCVCLLEDNCKVGFGKKIEISYGIVGFLGFVCGSHTSISYQRLDGLLVSFGGRLWLRKAPSKLDNQSFTSIRIQDLNEIHEIMSSLD